jgi:hypothetical protein
MQIGHHFAVVIKKLDELGERPVGFRGEPACFCIQLDAVLGDLPFLLGVSSRRSAWWQNNSREPRDSQ